MNIERDPTFGMPPGFVRHGARKFRRRALGAGYISVALLMVAACGTSDSSSMTTGESCHPDGKPTENTVVFNSSGGTYGEALEKVFFKEFEKECGVKVKSQTDARTYTQLKQQVETGNTAWDIGATRADEEFPLGIRDGLFHKLPADFWNDLSDKLVDGSFNEYGAWSTPYSDVLIYNTEKIKNAPTGWKDFWDVSGFPGKRTVQDSPATFVMALLADGVSKDQLYPLDYARAEAKLDKLRPHIRSFWKSGDEPVQGVANGEFSMGTAWNGRVYAASQAGKPVEAVWNGALLRTSWTFILEGAKHTRAAEALLHFMQRSDLQAKTAELTGYSGGNTEVPKLVPDSLSKWIATTPEHVEVASLIDAEWWADNLSDAQARWDAWKSKG